MVTSNKLCTFLSIIIILAFLLLFSAACGPVTAAPPSRTSTPTITFTPTASPTLTPTHNPQYPQLNRLATLGKGVVSGMLRSADGKIIAISDYKALTILSSSDGRQIATIPFSAEGITSNLAEKTDFTSVQAISPNNRFVLVSTGCCGIGMALFDLETKKMLNTFGDANAYALDPIFMPDSQSFVYSIGTRYSDRICYESIDQVTSKSGCYPSVEAEDYRFTSPALSPDGRLVAAAYADRSQNILYIWDVQKKSIQFELKGQAAEIKSVAFSPDGRLLASAGAEGLVRLWNPATGTLKRTITGFLDDIDRVAFTPNGGGLIVSVRGHPDTVYDLASGEQSAPASPTLDPLALKLMQDGSIFGGYNFQLRFSPDGKKIAVAGRSIQIWDVQTRQLLQTFAADGLLSLTYMTYSPDGEHLAVIDNNGNLFSWNIIRGQRELTLSSVMLAESQPLVPNENTVFTEAGAQAGRSVAFSPDGKLLVVGNGLTVDVWEIANVSKRLTLEQTQPAATPTAVSFSADGRFIYAVLDQNHAVVIWDAATGKLVRRRNLPVADTRGYYPSVTLQGSMFARNNADSDGTWMELWDLVRGKMRKLPTATHERIDPLHFSADGRFFVARAYQQIYIWRVDTGQLVFVSDNTFYVDDLAINPAGDLLATVKEGQVSLWELGPHLKTAFTANFTPPAPPTAEPTDTRYYVETPQPTQVVRPLPLPRLAAGAISVENASKLRVTGSFGNGQLSRLVWDQSGILVTTSDGVHPFDPVSLKATSHFALNGISDGQARLLADGQLLAAAALRNGKIQLWDAGQNKMLLELPGAGEPDISPDGKTLVFARESGGLVTWDIETGQAALLRSGWKSLSWPVFSPDGKRVAAIQSDRSIRIWDAATGEIVDGLGGPPVGIEDISFSPDGSYIVAVAGASAWAWHLQNAAPPVQIALSEGGDGENQVSAVAMDKTNTRIAVASTDHTIWLYDARSAKVLGKLTGDDSNPIALTFSPDNAQLLSLDADGRMIVWDLTARQPVLTSQAMQLFIRGFVVRKDGRLSAWGKNTIWTLDADKSSLQATASIPGGKIIAVSPVDDLAAAYSPFQVSLYDAVTGQLKLTLPDEAKKVEPEYYWQREIPREFYGATFDDRYLATFGTGGLWLYNLPDGKKISHVDTDKVLEASFSPDHDWVIPTILEQIALRTCPHALQTKDAHELMILCSLQNVSQTRISPDKRWLAGVMETWGDDTPSLLLIADTSTGQISKKLSFGKEDVVSLAFNPDASLIALGHKNGKVTLVNFATMQVVASLAGHHTTVDQLSFSADGRSLFSLDGDGVLKIWSLP